MLDAPDQVMRTLLPAMAWIQEPSAAANGRFCGAPGGQPGVWAGWVCASRPALSAHGVRPPLRWRPALAVPGGGGSTTAGG